MASDVVEYKAKDGQLINLSLETVRKYLIRGNAQAATSQEIIFFMGICKSKGLNPFKQDCYLVKYGTDPAAIIQSIDYFRARAKAQPDCTGWNKGLVVKDKKTGEQRKTRGILDRENEILMGAWFKAQPKGWIEPCEWEINLFNYIKKTKDGRITRFWSEENQPTQIAKVAESQGLRTCWPDEFQGLYSDAEIVEEESIVTEKPKPKKEDYQPKEIEETLPSKYTEQRMKVYISPDITDIELFEKLNKKALEEFEKKHRDDILRWPKDAQDAFKKKWESKMKQSYEDFLRQQNLINNEMESSEESRKESTSDKKTSGGLGIVKCPETNEAVTFTYCKMAKCVPFKEKSCMARFPG